MCFERHDGTAVGSASDPDDFPELGKVLLEAVLVVHVFGNVLHLDPGHSFAASCQDIPSGRCNSICLLSSINLNIDNFKNKQCLKYKLF